MCAMTRQPEPPRLVLVAALGVTFAACGLDRQGTEFTTQASESQRDGGAAVQGRPDASAGEASDQVAHALGVASADASRPALATETASSQGPDDSTEDSGSAVDAPSEAASSDAGPAGEAGSPEAAPVTGTSCDHDGDGHLAVGPPCFGDDCCDSDPDVHPGQTAYFTTPSQCGGFDYDCDGAATPQYGVASCTWAGLGCAGDGFVNGAACGDTAPFTVCAMATVLTCVGSVGSLTQACR